MDTVHVNNITMDMCQLVTGSKSLALVAAGNGQIPPCKNWTSVVALVLACIGIIANIVNIAIFLNNLRNKTKVQILFLALAVADLLILLSQIPYFVVVVTGRSKQLTSNTYSKYLIARYTASYVCICAAGWILVAMVLYDLKYKEEANEEQFGSELVLDSTDEYFNRKYFTKNSVKTQVTIVSLISLIATVLHIIKAFEFKDTYNQSRPYRLAHGHLLDNLWYEIFSLVVNVGLTSMFPFIFHLAVATYLLVRIVLMKFLGRFRAENITLFKLYFVLSLVYCMCNFHVIFAQIRQVFFHKYSGSCMDKIGECFVFLYCGIKIVPYLCFNDMKKDMRSFKAQYYFPSQVSMQPSSVGFVPSQVFENPIFKDITKAKGENTTF